jgi:hypothetical protein
MSNATALKAGHVVWTRNLNLEAKLNHLEVEWDWRTGIRLTDIYFDRNPSRLAAKVDQDRAFDIAFKIVETGLELPGLLLSETNKKLECLGGFHRSTGCKEANVKTVDGYVVTGIGRSTRFQLSVIDNAFEGSGLSVEERLERAVEEIRRLRDNQEPVDLDVMAENLSLEVKKLKRKVSASEFRTLMSQPDTFVPGGDKLPEGVMETLNHAFNGRSVSQPIVLDVARLMTRVDKPTSVMLDTVFKRVREVKPFDETTQRAELHKIEGELKAATESKKKQKAEGGTTRQKPTADALIIGELTRCWNATEALDKADLKDLFKGDKREAFVKVATNLRNRLSKALRSVEE